MIARKRLERSKIKVHEDENEDEDVTQQQYEETYLQDIVSQLQKDFVNVHNLRTDMNRTVVLRKMDNELRKAFIKLEQAQRNLIRVQYAYSDYNKFKERVND